MKRAIILILTLLAGCTDTIPLWSVGVHEVKRTAPAPLKKLLFLPFYNEAGDKNYVWLETSIGNNIHAAAEKKYRYIKITDAAFTKYFAAYSLGAADLYDFERVAKMAKDLGADGVIYGTFRPDSDGTRLILTGKILSVIDRELVEEKTVTMPVSAEMFTAVEDVSAALGANIGKLFFPSDKGAVVRAAVLPGWGHMYKQRRGWGYFYGAAFWTGFAFTAFTSFQYLRYRIGYANYAPEHTTDAAGRTTLADPVSAQTEFDRYTSNIQTYGTLALTGLAATTVIYLANVLHAWGIAPDVGSGGDIEVSAKMRTERNLPGTVTELALVWKF